MKIRAFCQHYRREAENTLGECWLAIAIFTLYVALRAAHEFQSSLWLSSADVRWHHIHSISLFVISVVVLVVYTAWSSEKGRFCEKLIKTGLIICLSLAALLGWMAWHT